MKRFRFTLQALLTVRQRAEQLAQERYAARIANQERARKALNLAEATLATAATTLRQQMGRGLLAAELAQRHTHLRTLEWSRAQAEEGCRSASRAVEPALREMLEARRRREAVEQFRRRQLQRHDREVQREDNRLLDEFALRRATPSLVWRGTD